MPIGWIGLFPEKIKSDNLHGDLGIIQPDDALLLISNSGKTREILELVELADRLYQDLPLIVITAKAESGLAKTADVCLLTGDPKKVCPLGLSPTTSTTMMTVIGDVLIVLMMDKIGFTNEEYSKRHHGGYLFLAIVETKMAPENPQKPPSPDLFRNRLENMLQLDERTTWFYEAVTSSDGMVNPEVGLGQVYMTTKRDNKGQLLRADKTYRLHVPANVPAKQFWSLTLYSEQTRRPYDNGGTDISGEQPTKDFDSSDIAEYIKWFPAIKQVEMRDAWLKDHKMGEWQFTGSITADDKTVVTPQAGANYGYSWFNISNEPVVITMPEYDKYYSLSIFDMNHFMEVRVPHKPVVIRLPHQKSSIEDSLECGGVKVELGFSDLQKLSCQNPATYSDSENISLTWSCFIAVTVPEEIQFG